MKTKITFYKSSSGIIANNEPLENIQQFIEAIDYFRDTFHEDQLWYRGVSHARYELIPKVYRDRLWEKHEDFEWWLFVTFKTRARAYIANHHNYSEWDWYFTMQHYGLPTRLLDWTRAALIALYFAVRNPEDTYLPSVYIINPYWIDETAHNKCKDEGRVYITDIKNISDEHCSLLSQYLGTRKEAPPFPLCLEPPSINCRIQAQHSMFTIHGKYINPFKHIAKNVTEPKIAKIRLNTGSAYQIKYQLDGMGVSEATLFPDLEGLSRDIITKRGI